MFKPKRISLTNSIKKFGSGGVIPQQSNKGGSMKMPQRPPTDLRSIIYRLGGMRLRDLFRNMV